MNLMFSSRSPQRTMIGLNYLRLLPRWVFCSCFFPDADKATELYLEETLFSVDQLIMLARCGGLSWIIRTIYNPSYSIAMPDNAGLPPLQRLSPKSSREMTQSSSGYRPKRGKGPRTGVCLHSGRKAFSQWISIRWLGPLTGRCANNRSFCLCVGFRKSGGTSAPCSSVLARTQ